MQELLPIRYGRMVASPFAFYRGGAAIMAADLAATPRSGLIAQLCGDAHLSNFGAFLSPERTLLFDINDFDETLPGPWEWDLKRLAASFEIAGRSRGFDRSTRRDFVLTVSRAYRDAMADFAGQSNMEVWYARGDIEKSLSDLRAATGGRKAKRANRRHAARVQHAIDKARRRDSTTAFARLTELTDGEEPHIVSAPPLVVPLKDLLKPAQAASMERALEDIFRTYRATLPEDRRHLLEKFRVVDVARKVVGVGSVGTRAWIVLALGRDGRDPLFLQFKESQASVLEAHLGRSRFANHGRRVVEGQRLMQAASDLMLGWTRADHIQSVPADYYVRQLWDGKGSLDIETAAPGALVRVARSCAWTLARAHARSGDPVAISAYLGASDSFPEAIYMFARDYADQNERDHAALQKAVKSGRVPAEMGI